MSLSKKRIIYAWEYYYESHHNGDEYGETIVYTENCEKEPSPTEYRQWDGIRRRQDLDIVSQKNLEKLNRGLIK